MAMIEELVTAHTFLLNWLSLYNRILHNGLETRYNNILVFFFFTEITISVSTIQTASDFCVCCLVHIFVSLL